MSLARVGLITTAVLASMASGLSKQLEAPLESAAFALAGVPVEALSLFGAVEFVLALLLIFARPRGFAALLLAGLFAWSAYILWPLGVGGLFAFNAAMVPLILAAAFWSDQFFARDDTYQGAIPLGFPNNKR